jgi:hypothetical protein
MKRTAQGSIVQGIYFTETKTVFGAYSPQDYGCGDRPDNYPVWLEDNNYIHLDYGGDGGTPEISLMILDRYLYTLDDAALVETLPIALAAVDFFRQHYPNRTADNKYVIWPTQVLETYWCAGWDTVNNQPPQNCCVDDTPTVSGLKSFISKLLQLPAGFIAPDTQKMLTAFLSQLPDIAIVNNTIAPARVVSSGVNNDETPELYAVHPYRLFTVGTAITVSADLTPAINVFGVNSNANVNEGWQQGIMDAALLGMTNVAARMVLERAATGSAPGYRFQAFMPHMQDYEPSADHLANMNSAVNWMLLQSGDDSYGNTTIVVFPAWPCDWDVQFKLWAPGNTTVEVDYQSGQLVSITVVPQSRQAAVRFANCVPQPI